MNSEPLSVNEALARAKSLSKKGRLPEAIQLYKDILARVPKHKKARNELKKLEKRHPNSRGAQLHQNMSRLMTLYSDGDATEAMTFAIELSKRYPDQPLPVNIAGALTLEEEGPDAAIELFKRAIDIEPAYPDAQSNLANVYLKQNEYESACRHYEIAVSLSPKNADLYYYLGRAKKGMRRRGEAHSHWQSALAIDPKHFNSLVALGFLLSEEGQVEQAIAQFHMAIALKPKSVGALSGLGYALKMAVRDEEAIEYLERALTLKPDAIQIEYFLKALKGHSTDTAPERYVTDLFDAYAEDFEIHLVETLGYMTPQFLAATLSKVAPQVTSFDPALDIGCGSGLCAEAFGELAGAIDGLDISKKMIEKARAKNLYRTLWAGDALEVLSSTTVKYRLLIAADVFAYIGNLEPIFMALAQAVSADAYFTFSTEHTDEGDFTLSRTGRFKHSRTYIDSMARKAGFVTLHFETHNLRKENDEWIIGGGYILHKP